MLMGSIRAVTAAACVMFCAQGALAQQTDDELIANAVSAAPAAVGKNAAVMVIDDQMNMRAAREGTNGFTCMPDNPQSPGNDPMCFDANGWAWAEAWMTKKEPPAGKIGFVYMLQGGSDAHNTDPFATEPAAEGWVDTGPHVMIVNYGDAMQGYPSQGDKPDTTQPYVMWAGTPYAHLMIPVD